MATPLASSALAQDFSPAAIEMFHALRQQPNDLARYVFLVKTVQELPAADRPLGMQMFASVENELGLYNEALRDFPLKSHVAVDMTIPTATQATPRASCICGPAAIVCAHGTFAEKPSPSSSSRSTRVRA
ncbi:hypothetical protein [Rhodanobacter sp. B2A1Ga4]|uniref:hypothetical protein n=1 Tax=Rhodanobacter sp. B2A1Ga4 TaxID=2778647 RepID=UPI001FD464DE|nr:hypothetical protein [Rhodanobacter sp. B2A1Ga4]